MSQLALERVSTSESTNSQWQNLCKIGGIATFIQLLCILVTVLIGTILGPEPATAQEYFTVLQNDRLAGILRLDFATLILLSLFTITSFSIYAALRESDRAYAGLSTALIYVGTILGLANHSAFSMINLSDQFAAATSITQQEQLLAAGQGIIASDMWNSTAGFLAGIFLQGAFVFISVVMLKRKTFGKWTATTGILSNGFDLIHVFVGLFMPSLGLILLYISGPFYLIWFILLGRDLYRLGSSIPNERTLTPSWE